MQGPLYFDIETQAHPRAEDWIGIGPLGLSDLSNDELRALLAKFDERTSGSKEVLIERVEAIPASGKVVVEAELDALRAERVLDEISKAPLDPDLGAIRAIGWASEDGQILVGVVSEEKSVFPSVIGETDIPFLTEVYSTEAELLEHFWFTSRANGNRLVGANILNFDIPYLLRRSMDLNVPPERLNLRRFQTEPICDLMQILAHWGAMRFKPLKWTCQRYGISIPMPETDGSMVADMSDADLVQYTASDVYITRELWRKMDGIYWPGRYRTPQSRLPL